MKKIKIFLFLLFISCYSFAQLTLEHTYDSASSAVSGARQQFFLIRLEVDGDKYAFADKQNKLLKLYNLNHTLWKTISFATAIQLNSNNVQGILYISQHLFDTDNEIEFLYCDQNINSFVTQIFNEDGSILTTIDNQGPFVYSNAPQIQLPIYNTSAGTKLILSGEDGKAYVYGLTGTLTASTIVAPEDALNQLKTSFAYPNPTSSSTKIDYTLPNGVNTGEIVFYDTQGKEIKRFNVDNTLNSLQISTEDLQSGTYYYNLQTEQGVTGAKKLVTVK